MLVRVASAPPNIPGLSDWRAMARGGFATVWEARQDSLNRLVAVKVDQRRLDTDTERRRFLREAGAAGRLSGHPGIVTVHDAGILADGRPFLVMELCPGGSLTRWLPAANRHDERTIRDVGVRIADALAAAHARGVLHRDVKPANILIDAYHHAGLADFGLAAIPDPGLELSATIEAITPAYAPPEAFRQETPTEFGDVFSLAATLYAVLSGRPPRWPDSTTPSVPDMLERQDEPIEVIPGVDPDLMDLLQTAMSAEPSERPTAARFRDELAALPLPGPAARVLSTEWTSPPPPIPANPASRLYGAGGPPQRRVLVVIAILAVLLIGAIVAGLVAWSRPSVSGGPTPVLTTSDAVTVTPTPPVQVPEGFILCSARYGGTTFCARTAECWAGVISVSDVPAVATPRACPESHVYQTFAAGRLGYDAHRQSQLEGDKQVRKVCTLATANAMLAARYRRTDWEILVVGPQRDNEDYYRCLFGRGLRSNPFVLTPPR
jgi:hypothetical protein